MIIDSNDLTINILYEQRLRLDKSIAERECYLMDQQLKNQGIDELREFMSRYKKEMEK